MLEKFQTTHEYIKNVYRHSKGKFQLFHLNLHISGNPTFTKYYFSTRKSISASCLHFPLFIQFDCSLNIDPIFVPFLLYSPKLLGNPEGLTGLTSCAVDGVGVQKSRIRETKHLSSDADSSTDAIGRWTKGKISKKTHFFFARRF